MVNKMLLALTLGLSLAATAKAVDQPLLQPSQVVAYWISPADNNEWVVLTNLERKNVCPPFTYTALKRENGETRDGCWTADADFVLVFWTPDYQAENFSWRMFNVMYNINGTPAECSQLLTPSVRGL